MAALWGGLVVLWGGLVQADLETVSPRRQALLRRIKASDAIRFTLRLPLKLIGTLH